MSVGEENTQEEKSPDRRSFVRRHPILVGLTAFWSVLYWFFGAGILNSPRFHWYTVTAEFVIDGKLVTVSGTIECAKTWRDVLPWHLLVPVAMHRRGLPYSTSAGVIAKRLPSGVALVIDPREKGVPACEGNYRGPFKEFPKDHVPWVYWLDDAESPTRIERYKAEYYKGPNPRVKLTGFSVARLGYGAFSRSQIWGRTYSSLPIQEVPWLGKSDQLFEGWSATIARKDLWGKVPAIREVAASYDQLSTIIYSELPNPFVRAAIGSLIWQGTSKPAVRSDYCVGVDVAECESYNNTFGIVHQSAHDVVPTTQGLVIPAKPAAPGRVTFAPRLTRKVDGNEEISAEIFGEKIVAPRGRFKEFVVFSAREQAFLYFRPELIKPERLMGTN